MDDVVYALGLIADAIETLGLAMTDTNRDRATDDAVAVSRELDVEAAVANIRTAVQRIREASFDGVDPQA